MRLALAWCLGLGIIGLSPPLPAGAHGGEQVAEPVIERVGPSVAGIKVEIVHSVSYQFLASNTSDRTITFLADTGEAFLRIGPDGVQGNFASPAFFDSNDPQGVTQFPSQAKPGPDVPPIWKRVSRERSWGWYDHRLHPADPVLTPDVIRANKPAVLGQWKVPITVGDEPGEVVGRFEFKPTYGSYTMTQKSPTTPAEGVKLQVLPGSRVPAVFAENLSADPLVVLGRGDEPFVRVGPKVTEVNVKSPTWVEVQQAKGEDPSEEADASAEPKWQQVADAPRWTWPEFRAAAPAADPPQAVLEGGKATTVRTWSIPYLVGGQRRTVDGITEFVPIAVQRDRAGLPGSDDGSDLPLLAGAGLAAVLVGGGGLVAFRRRQQHTTK